MKPKNHIFYNAYSARDARFDGVFFIGVTSTGIYCRPICPARIPKEENCLFFMNGAAAEKADFRPCLRCRPELAPGNAPIDDAQRIANLLTHNLSRGAYDEHISLEEIAAQFELSSRQVRRIIQNEFGVSPLELIMTRRLLLAKQLLTDTVLPIIQIAYTSGFSSLRRFNDAFSAHYKMPPSRFRKNISNISNIPLMSDKLKLQLYYRPPYDFISILNFLRKRALKGVETVFEDTYIRTVQIGKHNGWLSIQNNPQKNALIVIISMSLLPVLSALLHKIRDIFDLNARPDVITAQLVVDPLLSDLVMQNPGLRVPGAFDGFELAVRAILGQQVTVKAATTLAGRFVTTFGTQILTPYNELTVLCPTSKHIAQISVEEIASLGIIQSRAKSIICLAQEMSSGRLKLNSGTSPAGIIEQLITIPGIGKWTAHYIAMRALRWPDAFPKEDIVLRNNLGGVTPKQAEELSQKWRPWRSYATVHLWQKLA